MPLDLLVLVSQEAPLSSLARSEEFKQGTQGHYD